MISDKTKPKKLLYEVSVIRPLIIALLVFMHSFTKIALGAGGRCNDYQLVEGYQWLVWFIQGFRIETIALVAGYVFSYQSLDLGRSYRFWPFVWKKFKRLIIPMLVFGVAYYFMFFYSAETFTVKEFIVMLLSGCGHLWFLPMLFWCFIAIWLIDHFKLNSWWLLVLLAFFSLIPTPRLPLGFSRLPHFLFYVYGGYFLWTKREFLFKHCLSWKWISALWMVYVGLVIVSHIILSEGGVGIMKVFIFGLSRTSDLLMAVFGVIALYLTACHFTTQEGFKPKPWVITASDNCYGIYVYHQFVLTLLYFFTSFVAVVHPLLVPWFGFAIIMTVSLLLTWLTLKTNTGRFLIG